MKGIKKKIAVFLAFAFLMSMMPPPVLALDGEEVLTSISHTDVGTGEISGTNITFTVNYNYSDTIYLSEGLNITYNSDLYTTAIASFEQTVVDSGVIPGQTVDMTVSYKKTGDDTLYSTVYKVAVVKAAYRAPTFSGTISKSVTLPNTLTLSITDFTGIYDRRDGEALGKVKISGSNPAYGSLMLSGSTEFFGSMISVTDLGNLTFAATDTGEEPISYMVEAYAAGDDSNLVGTAFLSITVNRSTSAGTVTLSTNSITPVTLSASSFSSAFSSANGATLSYIKFPSLPSSSTGVLHHNYVSSSNPGTVVSTSDSYNNGTSPSISEITFVPSSSYSGTASISYTAYDTDSHSYTGTLHISVSAAAVSDLAYSIDNNDIKTFSDSDFNTLCYNLTGNNLSYVNFALPSSSYGVLYYNYTSSGSYDSKVSASTKYYRGSSQYLKYVSFVPDDNYSGTVSISYTGYSTTGQSYTGTVKIAVSDSNSADTITYETDQGEEAEFDADDFNDVCNDVTDENLSYVKFTLPSSSYGVLYYNYTSASSYTSKVSASTKYYRSSSLYLDNVSFVPDDDYSGTVTISYTGYSTGGDSYTGKVKITVSENSSADAITYETDQGEEAEFDVDDFNDMCDAETDENLSYVKFTLPSSSYGVLYYNYTSATNYTSKVSASTKYYRSSSLYLDNVSFVPDDDYSGTITLSYTGYSTGGDSYSGKIKITVGDSADSGTITYETDQGEEAEFDVDDFNNVCDNETLENLSYVKFTLPSSSYGVLYYNYTSSTSYTSKVSASTKYYRSSSLYLDNVSFVPDDDYSGTVTISYTGYSTGGDSYTGEIKITVGDSTDSGIITYETDQGEEAEFDADDFNDVCDAETDENLSYVKFTLPSSSYGVLYYNYTSSTSYGSKVSASTKYYRSSSSYLDDVSFVPDDDYTGIVTLSYTGYSTGGDSYTGKIKITVGSGTVNSINYSTKKGIPVTFSTTDFSSATSKSLSYVKFTLPSSTYGKLYYNYTASLGSGTAVSAATKYYKSSSPYIFSVTFVPNSNFTGTATINYTGYSTDGDSYSGKVYITVTASGKTSTYFLDVNDNYSWAIDAIDSLYLKSIVTGTGTKQFSPSVNITRGDFMLMLYRALNLKSSGQTSNFSDVTKDSYYYTAVLVAKSLGVAKGENGKFNPKKNITRQDAMVFVTRALKVSGKSLITGSKSDISSFGDDQDVSDYALEAVCTLIKAKIITGNNSKINPKSSVTRAEMAVILYRVIN